AARCGEEGWIGWGRANRFATPFNGVLTVFTVLLLAWIVPPTVRFLVIDAVWTGTVREACLASAQHPHLGACWAFVTEYRSYFTYGSYPIDQRWPGAVIFLLLAFRPPLRFWIP